MARYEIEKKLLKEYYKNLQIGGVFDYDLFVHTETYPCSTIVKFKFVKIHNKLSILVMGRSESLNPWSIVKVTIDEGFIVHSCLGAYFDKNKAEIAYVLAN